MYDPYMIEFLIRTKIMSYNDEYFYIHHAAYVDKMFDYKYTKSLFYAIENKDLSIMQNINKTFIATKIEDPNSLFVTRLEDYYMIDIDVEKYQYITRFMNIDMEVYEAIVNNKYIDSSNKNYPYNILVAYINNDTNYISDNLVNIINSISYNDSNETFYIIPIIMVIISKYIENLAS